MFNFHRPLFPILDPTFLVNILLSNSLTLFFLSEWGTKLQAQDDSLTAGLHVAVVVWCNTSRTGRIVTFCGLNGWFPAGPRNLSVLRSVHTGSPSPSWWSGIVYAICWLGCGLEIWVSVSGEAMNFTRLRNLHTGCRPAASYLIGTGILSPGIKGLEREATSHLSLVHGLWMSAALPLLPLYAFVPCTTSSSLNPRTSWRVHFERLLFFSKHQSSITQYAAPPPRMETPNTSLCLPTN